MLVTEDGMVTDIRPEHPQKAPCARTGGGEQPASKLERAIVLRLHGAGRAWLYAAMLACLQLFELLLELVGALLLPRRTLSRVSSQRLEQLELLQGRHRLVFDDVPDHRGHAVVGAAVLHVALVPLQGRGCGTRRRRARY